MEFSPDSQYILVVISKRNQVEARAVYEEEWACKIEDPILGVLNAKWSPDSRHILTFSDYQMRLSIYSLVDKSIQYIKHPKFTDKGIFIAISFKSKKGHLLHRMENFLLLQKEKRQKTL